MRSVKLILKPILLLLLICNVSNLIAQQSASQTPVQTENNGEEPCAIDGIHERMLNEDPDYARKRDEMEQSLQSYIAAHAGQERLPILTVPVVVHVVHTGQPLGVGPNISDEQIYSAIAALNEDYRKVPGTNGDGIGVDCEIEFCLAVRDPDDNPHCGINRVDGSTVPLYAEYGMGAAEVGADDGDVKALSIWPNTDYYNIWIVTEIDGNNGGSGIQGYAYYPYAPSYLDGAVIMATAFGTVGYLKSYTNMNRTTSHELGHGLNLYHTFHNSFDCDESDCSSQGDYVCDTPVTPKQTSCSSPACSETQMVENYMDYTSQTCKNSFTQGQKDRMRSALSVARASLLTSDACTPVYNRDAAIIEVKEPNSHQCSATINPTVVLKNHGADVLTNVEILYSFDGGTTSSFTYSGSIDSQERIEVTLPSSMQNMGAHTFEAEIGSINGLTDEYLPNNSITTDFEVVDGDVITMVFKQDPYGSQNFWRINDEDGNILAFDGPFTGEWGDEHIVSVCVPVGCYDLTVFDSGGGGLIGSGDYYITDSEGDELVHYDGEEFSENVHNFCVDTGTAVAPTADFTVSSQTVCIGDGLDFTDLSTDSPTSWAWVFDGTNIGSSTDQNPTDIIYNTPGDYEVTLTATNSAGSSTETKTAYITVLDGFSLSSNSFDPTCGNSSDGYISVIPVGGSEPYSYDWSTGGTMESISGLAAGTYTVTVTDENGCRATETFTLSAPDSIIITEVSNIPDIDNAGIGSLEIDISGGNPNYTLSWSGPGLFSGDTYNITALVAGTYIATVTDANGCIEEMEFIVENNDPLNAEFESNMQNICVGEAINFINLSTGNPESYMWDFGNGVISADQNPTGISFTTAGEYTISLTVINASNQEDIEVKSAYITVSNVPLLSSSMEEPLCNGGSNGSIDLTATGAEPFEFSWSNGDVSEDISGLSADNYSVLVTDDNGCESIADVSLGQPDAIEINLILNIPDNNNSGSGSIEVEVNGGTEPFTNTWTEDGFVIGTDLTIEDLLAGTYELNVIDANGCAIQETFEVFNFDAPIANFIYNTDSPCEGGSVSFVDFSVNDPDNRLWEFEGGSPSTSTASNPIVTYAQAGIYNVTLTVENDYGTDVKTATIIVSDAISYTADVNNTTCFDGDDGAINLDLEGGSGSYIIVWNTGSTSHNIDQLEAGFYNFTGADDTGCPIDGTIIVGEPTDIEIDVIEIHPDSCNMNSGFAEIAVSGGNGGYVIEWDDPNLQSGNMLMNVAEGSYTAIVSDANSCEKEIEVDVQGLSCVGIGDELSILNNVTVYPNPFDGKTIQLSYELSNDLDISMYDVSGRAIDFELQTIGENLYQLNPKTNLGNGMYFLRIQDGTNFITKKISVNK